MMMMMITITKPVGHSTGILQMKYYRIVLGVGNS